MIIRYLADADLNQTIVQAVLRHEPELDFQTAHSANLYGLSDEKVLAIAAQSNRILVSHDRKTMPKQFANFISNEESCGLIIVQKKLPMNQVVDDLILIWMTSELEDWKNRIFSLPL